MTRSTSRPPSLTGLFEHLTAVQRKHSLERTISEAPVAGRLWLFAYGSLIWRPCFEVQSRRRAVLHGYGRSFCVYTVEARGTPELPGLGLGLRRGNGSCEGVMLALPEKDRQKALESIWEREMLTAVYQPRWLTVETEPGFATVLAFVVDQGHPQCAGDLPEDTQVELIGSAIGALGPCRDYLVNTIDALAAAGIRDPDLDDLLERVGH